MYTCAAQTAYSTGRYERIETLVSEIFKNSRELLHQLKASIALMESFVARNQTKRAFDFGLEILQDSKRVSMPSKVSRCRYLWNILKLKKVLRQFTDGQIKALQKLHDEELHHLMRMMNFLSVYALYCRPFYGPYLSIQVVFLTIKNGLCSFSATAFAMLGVFFCNHFGDIKLGFRLAQLSLDLIEELDDADARTRILYWTHCYIFALKEPMENVLTPLLTGHREGLANGDVEVGMLCAAAYTALSINASIPLSTVIEDGEIFLKLMESYRQTNVVQFMSVNLQFCLNMASAECDNPVELSGRYMNEELFRTRQSVNNPLAIAVLDKATIQVACFFSRLQSRRGDFKEIHKEGYGRFYSIPSRGRFPLFRDMFCWTRQFQRC